MTYLLSIQVSDESGQSMSELMQELQEVKGQVASTKEELNCFRELSHKLQEDIEVQTPRPALLIAHTILHVCCFMQSV